jgi:hypothetical protein
VQHLVDNGFLADLDLGHRHATPDIPAHEGSSSIVLMMVQQLQEEVKTLREEMAVMKQQAFNVFMFVLAVIVAVVLWK